MSWLEQIVEKFGDDFKWPPYPLGFEIPANIKKRWEKRKFYFNVEKNHCKIVPVLHTEENISVPAKGDHFNAVLIQRRKAKQHKGNYRVLSFDIKGYLHYENSLSGKPALKKGEVRAGLVYRFEVISVGKNAFRCVALACVFDKDYLIPNLTRCNYWNYRKDKTKIK